MKLLVWQPQDKLRLFIAVPEIIKGFEFKAFEYNWGANS
jgi:hypothetical protein